jgi:hypothetical protein
MYRPFTVGRRKISIYFFKRNNLEPNRFYDADRFTLTILQDAEGADARQGFAEFLVFPKERTGRRLCARQDQPCTFVGTFLAVTDTEGLVE